VESVILLDPQGQLQTVPSEELGFAYRESSLRDSGGIILEVCFKLSPAKIDDLQKTIQEILVLREEKHPPHNMATAGSFFKNLPPVEPGGRRIAAGLILDQAGAGGLSVGDAQVFEKHANIVVNRGHASARDVLQLTGQMKQMAYEHAGVILEEEVRRIGFSEDELPMDEGCQRKIQLVKSCSSEGLPAQGPVK
jgi:UDP-N-acetylmuramate dehydrogenase